MKLKMMMMRPEAWARENSETQSGKKNTEKREKTWKFKTERRQNEKICVTELEKQKA